MDYNWQFFNWYSPIGTGDVRLPTFIAFASIRHFEKLILCVCVEPAKRNDKLF